MNRICLVSYGLSRGGAERVSSLIANHLNSKGYLVKFIATRQADITYKLNKEIEYVCIENNNLHGIKKQINKNIRIIQEIVKFKPDVSLSFVINEVLLFMIIPMKCYKIASLRNDPKNTSRNLFEKLIRYVVFHSANKVVFQTNEAKSYFNRRIYRNGIVIQNPITDNLPKWNNNNSKIIITASKLEKQKNIKMLIDGFEKFSDSHENYYLHIYGDGLLREELQRYIESKKLVDKVCLKGFASNIHDIMADAAVFVMTSDYEGISNSMLEALAIGVPTICTDCSNGGARQYIKDYSNGILIPVGDVEALNSALEYYYSNYEELESISNKAREIRDVLSSDKILTDWYNTVSNANEKDNYETKI